jgi:hypothetical protein
MAVSQRPAESLSARSTAQRPPSSGARLTVVLLSTGSLQELESSVSAITSRLSRFGAQLVIVRAGDSADLEAVVEYPFTAFVTAPEGTTRAQLCDLGMSRANGDIIALRDAANVRDGSWLDSFSAAVDVADRPSERLVADWARLGSFGEAPLADIGPGSRSSERAFPPERSGPADVSLSPLPIA